MRPSSLAPLVLLAGGLSACGSDGADGGTASDPTGSASTASTASADSTVAVTRGDGSTFDVDGPFTVECVPSEDEPGTTLLRALVPHDPGVELLVQVDVDAVADGGRTYELTGGDDPDQLILFLVDLSDTNEVNSDHPDATGTVEVTAASCDGPPHLAVTIDAELGSESGLEELTVTGTLDATAG